MKVLILALGFAMVPFYVTADDNPFIYMPAAKQSEWANIRYSFTQALKDDLVNPSKCEIPGPRLIFVNGKCLDEFTVFTDVSMTVLRPEYKNIRSYCSNVTITNNKSPADEKYFYPEYLTYYDKQNKRPINTFHNKNWQSEVFVAVVTFKFKNNRSGGDTLKCFSMSDKKKVQPFDVTEAMGGYIKFEKGAEANPFYSPSGAAGSPSVGGHLSTPTTR